MVLLIIIREARIKMDLGYTDDAPAFMPGFIDPFAKAGPGNGRNHLGRAQLEPAYDATGNQCSSVPSATPTTPTPSAGMEMPLSLSPLASLQLDSIGGFSFDQDNEEDLWAEGGADWTTFISVVS